MKSMMRFMFISILMMVAAPAWSDAALHIITCQQDDELTDEKLEAISEEWLKAAKTVKGGENLKLYLNFPVAAKAGEVDVAIMLIAPSFAEWGAFMDNYAGSAAEDADSKHQDGLDCANGTLWESFKVE
jgi:hypothetical protein